MTVPTGKLVKWTSKWFKNLITNAGRTWMINRWANDTMTYGKAIAVGTGVTAPTLTQTTLVTETNRTATTNTPLGTPTWQVKFNAVFSASQVSGSTEIGVFDALAGGNMLSRNVHVALSVPPGASISFDYIFGLYSSKVSYDWVLTSGQTLVYEIADSVNVGGVMEMDTGNGYTKKTSIATVAATAGTYWHDSGANKTYVHCTDGLAATTHNIVVLSRAT